MDSSKLTKAEWCSIEVPLPPNEHRIVQFLAKSHLDLTTIQHSLITLIDYLKLSQNDSVDLFLFYKYFYKMFKHLKCDFKLPPKEKIKLKKADEIRLSTTSDQIPSTIYEYILLDICSLALTNPLHYYTLHVLSSYTIQYTNIYVKQLIQHMFQLHTFDLKSLVLHSVEMIEHNPYIYKHQPLQLHEHQRQLFRICQNPNPKLILYTAQTGSGKTLSPIGASAYYDAIIFMCAHRHVALSLARAAIAVQKKIATAFGAKSKEDIKLHYYAVSDCTRDKRNGKILKVDNSNGAKVELMICDIESFVHAQEYMLQFKSGDKMMVWLDEPTISLDYDEHPLHSLYKQNWQSNKEITTVLFSSATLPDDVSETFHSFQTIFENAELFKISSFDSPKSVQILNPENQIELPHYHCPTYSELQTCLQFIEQKRIVMKYFDLHAIILFLQQHATDYSYFKSIQDVRIENIKQFYLTILKTFTEEKWSSIFDYECAHRIQHVPTIGFCTSDAHTLENGPTIYITDDVTNVEKYCIKTSNIPESILTTILKNLGHNATISEKISQLEKDIEDANSKEEDKKNKMMKEQFLPEVRILQGKLNDLYEQILPIVLPDEYIPNKKAHLTKYGQLTKLNTVFSSNIDSTTAKSILALDIDNKKKLLLLMGIGVFDKQCNSKYMEIMKELATQQYLFIIIADSDYIYGTNYPFCQGYIGKQQLTPEKIIQAAGRVGRNQQGQKNSIRFRDIINIKQLFLPQSYNPEINNMKKIYS
jgi:hypothetical protein